MKTKSKALLELLKKNEDDSSQPDAGGDQKWDHDVEAFKKNYPYVNLDTATELARKEAEANSEEDMSDWPGIEDTMKTQGFKVSKQKNPDAGDEELCITTPYGDYFFELSGKYLRTEI